MSEPPYWPPPPDWKPDPDQPAPKPPEQRAAIHAVPVVPATGPTQLEVGRAAGGFIVLLLVPGVLYALVWFGQFGTTTVTRYWLGLALVNFLFLFVALAMLFGMAQTNLGLRAATGIVLLAYVAPLEAHIATLFWRYTHQQALEAQAISGGLPALVGVLALGWAVVGMANARRAARSRDNGVTMPGG
jgi:hypothetical protein